MSDQGGEYEVNEAIFMLGELYYRDRQKATEIRRLNQLTQELAADNTRMMNKLDELDDQNKEAGND